MPYIIMTDSHTDLPYTLVDKWDLPLALMPYSLDGEEHFADIRRLPRALRPPRLNCLYSRIWTIWSRI